MAAEEVRCGTVCVMIPGLKKATFGKFSVMEYWSRYWTQRRIIYGMDNYEKLTFGFKVSGKNRRTVYLVEWRRTVYLVEWKKNFWICVTAKCPCILLRQEQFPVYKMELKVERTV